MSLNKSDFLPLYLIIANHLVLSLNLRATDIYSSEKMKNLVFFRKLFILPTFYLRVLETKIKAIICMV